MPCPGKSNHLRDFILGNPGNQRLSEFDPDTCLTGNFRAGQQ
jgi:hypothetical protein